MTDILVTSRRTRKQYRDLVVSDIAIGKDIVLPITPHLEQKITSLRNQYSIYVAEFEELAKKISTAEEPEQWTFVQRSVEKIHHMSLVFPHYICVDSAKLLEFQTFMRESFGNIESRGTVSLVRIQVVVELADVDLIGLPFEFLYVGQIQPVVSVDRPVTLHEALRVIAGFRAIVAHRVMNSTRPSQLRRLKDERLPISIVANDVFYYNNPRQKAESEALWLHSQQSRFSAGEIWPDVNTDAATSGQRMSEWLTGHTFALSGTDAGGFEPCQIQHISCHYDAAAGALDLRQARRVHGQSEVPRVRVTVDDIVAHVTRTISQKGKRDGIHGPLLFINACGSGASDPRGLLSLIEALLRYSPARAIVVTETRVEFNLAARFSRRVYLNLLEGYSIGESLYNARWETIFLEKNPYGILYTLYGDPGLHLPKIAVR